MQKIKRYVQNFFKKSSGNAEYHRKEILNLLDKIGDSWILWQIHRFIVNMTKED